jgi:hypothetical protein
MRASISDQMTEANELNECRISNTECRMTKFDGHLRKPKRPFSVIPAKAGIQGKQELLDPGFRRGDGFYEIDRKYLIFRSW